MGPDLLKQIAATGIVGLMLALSLLALYQKDKQLKAATDAHRKELKAEQDARISDAKNYLELAMNLQAKVIEAVKMLGDIVETWEKREAERERIERENYRQTPPRR